VAFRQFRHRLESNGASWESNACSEGRDIFNKMEVHVCVEMDRTGRPPILDTVTSLRSDADSTGPSGTPKWIDVSI
jgi:hypothetical protein